MSVLRSLLMLLTQGTTFLLIVISLLVVSPKIHSETSSQPWIHYSSGCGYDHCVEVDFQSVPQNMEGSGVDSDFSDKFLLEAQEGPEEGSDSCTKPDPAATKCLFAKKNVYVRDRALYLLVPGHFKPNETITVAQVFFTGSQFITSGSFMVEIKTSKVPGTCQAIFTQANPGYPQQKDEQDIEILTGHYTVSSTNIAAGLQFTSWAAFPFNESMSERMINKVVPYEFDPTDDFHWFGIEWDQKTTNYSYNSKKVQFDKFASQNPAKYVINNWSNAGPFWSEGPPAEDNFLIVRRYKAYYNVKKNNSSGQKALSLPFLCLLTLFLRL